MFGGLKMLQKCLRVSKAGVAVLEVFLQCHLLNAPPLDTILKQLLFSHTQTSSIPLLCFIFLLSADYLLTYCVFD